MFIWDFTASVFHANHALGILNLKHYFLFFFENYVCNTSVALEKVLTTDGNTLSLYCALYTTYLQYKAVLAINISLQMMYTRRGSL